MANPTWKKAKTKARRSSRDEDGPWMRGQGNNAAAADADTGEMDAVDKADEALFDLLQRLHKGSTKVLPARDAPGKPQKKPA